MVREPRCREVLEKIFGLPFPKVRPEFLKNPEPDQFGRHNNLELDGYCESLALAFEHNGSSHYTFPHVFNPTLKAYAKLKARDNYKIDRCRELGIVLLIIKDKDEVPFDQIETEIRKQLRGAWLPPSLGERYQ